MKCWRKHLQKILVNIITLVLLLSLICVSAFAESETPASKIKQGDILCFGTPNEVNGFDGKWLVLDAEQTNMGTDGMFLVSLSLIGNDDGENLLYRDIGDVSVSFADRGESYAQAHPGVTDYRGSDIQLWCDTFLSQHFTEEEQFAMLPTLKSDSAISLPGLNGAGSGTVDFDPAENVLNGDRIFLLSAEEVTNEAYGFTDNASRIALYKGTAGSYWLRSPHTPSFPLDVGFVFSMGAVMDYPVNAQSMYHLSSYARVACNLDRTKIMTIDELFVSDNTTIWRITMEGAESNTTTYDLSLPVVGE